MLAAGMLVVGLVLGVGAMLLLGDDASVKPTSTTGGLTSAAPGDGGVGPRSGAGSGPGSGVVADPRNDSVRAVTQPTTTAGSITAPGPAEAEFTSASASPSEFTCEQGEVIEIEISWTTENATAVKIEGGAFEQSPDGQLIHNFSCGTRANDYVTLVARGPRGDVSRRVGWDWTFRRH